jgi:hypothetical protein
MTVAEIKDWINTVRNGLTHESVDWDHDPYMRARYDAQIEVLDALLKEIEEEDA